jgi:hypothetical protein
LVKKGEFMTSLIHSEHFTRALNIVLDETFDEVRGIYLDRGTSLFETLNTISAEKASLPVGGKCATLAAQVKHVAFYLDVVDGMMRNSIYPEVDWTEIWRTTSKVNPEEWQAIKKGLRESYNRIKTLIRETPEWPSESEISEAIGVVVHTAYHLGEIRQALCTLKE